MKQNAAARQSRSSVPLGQMLYLKDYLPAQPTKPHTRWERTPGIPEWLEQVSIWTERLFTGAMTVLSVGWMWYCMVCM